MMLLDFEIFNQDLSYQYMCQMDKETIVQVTDGRNKCRVCFGMNDQLRITNLPDYPGAAREWPSLCRTSQNHAFLIGGQSNGDA